MGTRGLILWAFLLGSSLPAQSSEAPVATDSLLVSSSEDATSVERPSASSKDFPNADVIVSVARHGHFRIEVSPEVAPDHVATFLTLAARGYYDRLTFHRVVPRLLVQTGAEVTRAPLDSLSVTPLLSPFRLSREPDEPLGHEQGSVALAWREGPGSAGAHWYVSLEDNPALDDHGTVIGKVIDGWETVDRISQVSTHRNWSPRDAVLIDSVRVVPKMAATEGEAAENHESSD